MKTVDKIIRTALHLFNEQGEREVSTNHIAAAAGVSPGNLYYHFRHKEAIVLRLFDGYEAQLQARLPDTEVPTLAGLHARIEAGLAARHEYRFLFRALPELLARNPELARRFRAAQQLERADWLERLRGFADAGVLRLAAAEFEPLVDNLQLLANGWLAHAECCGIELDGGRRGTRQALALLRPHLAAEHRAAFDAPALSGTPA